MSEREYGIRLDNGHVVEDGGWQSPACVMHSLHGFGVRRVYGVLVYRKRGSQDPWEPYPHQPATPQPEIP